jgi:hypothetical protein
LISQPFLFYINTRNKYFLFLALTFVDKKDRIILSDKRRVELTKPKIGRPTDDPKPFKIDVRLSERDINILDDYCKRTGKTRPESVREAIRGLKEK